MYCENPAVESAATDMLHPTAWEGECALPHVSPIDWASGGMSLKSRPPKPKALKQTNLSRSRQSDSAPSRFIPTQQFPNGNVPASRQSTQTAHLMQVAKHKPAVAASDEHLGAKPAPNPPNEKIPFTIRKIPALQPFFQCCILLNKRRGFPDVSPSAKVSLSFRGSLIGSFLHFPPDHPPTKPLERACWKAGPAALPRAALQSAPQVPAI